MRLYSTLALAILLSCLASSARAQTKPVIDGQSPIAVQEDHAYTLLFTDLLVTDPDSTYPDDFTLVAAPGANYSVAGTTITPDADYNGDLTVMVTVNDGTQNSDPFAVTISVLAVNDPPVITGQDVLTMNENTLRSIALGDVTVTDVDNTPPAGFSLTVLAGANYTTLLNVITPALNFVGTLTVNVTVSDGTASSAVFPLQVAVNAFNIAPVIISQNAVSTPEETAITVGFGALNVLDINNPYPTGFTLTLSPGANYSLVGTTVTPALDFNGTLTVNTIVNDGTDDSNIFPLQITVTPVNDAPVITGQNPVSTNEDTPLAIALNDLLVTDPDDTYPGGFTLTVTGGTNYTFSGTTVTPAANFNGVLSVNVRVNDGAANSNLFALQVSVTAVNDAPVITGQNPVSVNEDTPIAVPLTALLVTDPDDTYPGTFTLSLSAGTNYTVSGTTVTPAANFSGVISVGAVVNDGSANSNSFNLQITVNPVNDPPVITGQNPVTTNEDTPVALTLANLLVTDVDNTYPTGFTLSPSGGANYTLSGNTVTPALNFNGVLSVPVTVSDGTSPSNTFNVQITVNAVNDPPVITGQNPLNVDENQSITLHTTDLLVTDPDNVYPTGFSVIVLPGTGYSFSGTVITPTTNTFGTISVNARVNDGTDPSATFAVQITVNHVNVAPSINGQTALTTNEDTPITILTSNLAVTDPDNTYPTGFSLAFSAGANYTVAGNTITPALNFNGILSVGTIVNDGTANSNSFSLNITVTAVNDAPVITGQNAVNGTEDTPFSIGPANLLVTDPDDIYPTDFTFSIVAGTNYTFSGTTVTPALNFNGTLSVNVRVNDGSANSNTFALQVTIAPVNDAPVITGQTTVSTPEETSVTVQLTDLLVTDVDNAYPGTFTYTVAAGTNYTVAGHAVTPNLNFSGTLSVGVVVNDGSLSSNSFNLQITVTPVNDPPVITAQTVLATNEDTPITLQFSNLTVTDPDNTYPSGFSLVISGGANYSFSGNTITPALNYNGPISVNVKVNDGTSDSAPFALQITVNPVNDAPVITGQSALSTGDGQPITLLLSQLIVSDPDNTYPSGFSLSVLSGANYSVSGDVVTPSIGFSGNLPVKIFVNDGSADSPFYTLTIQVNYTNKAPVITGQKPVAFNEDTPYTVKLTDLTVTDPDNVYPTDFTLTVQAGSNYTFAGNVVTPALNFNGTLTIKVLVNDGSINSNSFSLAATVNPVNDAPVITGQSALSVAEDTPLAIALANLTVTDVDNSYPTGFSLSLAAGANYTVSGNTITPALNFDGILSVGIIVNDGSASSAPFTLQITVTPVNDAPVITGQQAISVNEDSPVGVLFTNLLVTDADNTYPNGYTLALAAGANYTLAGNIVTPALNFNGILTIPATVNDGTATSNSFNLKITVLPVNDPPVITGQNPLSTNQNTPITLQLSNLVVTDPDNAFPTGFTLTVLAGTNYTFSGTTVSPAAAFSGTLAVNVTVSDGSATSGVFALQINVNHINTAPVITGQTTISVNEDTPVTIQFTNLTVSDPDNSYPTGFSLSLSPGTNYTLSGNTVTPAANFNGVLSVGAVVNDGQANSNSFNLQVTVVPVNDPPTSKGFATVTLAEDFAGTTSVNLAAVFSDIEDASTALTYSILTNDKPTYFSSIAINQATDQLQFTLAPNFFGTAKINIRATDTGGQSVADILTIVITPVNDPPSFDPIGDVNIGENAGPQSITITNISAGPLETETLLLSATSGNNTLIPTPTITYNGTGATATLSFTPVASESGTAVITVKLVDTGLNEFTRTFNINVTTVNDPPTLDAIGNLTVLEDAIHQLINLTGITAGPQETQPLQVTVAADKPELFDTLQITYTSPQTTGVLKIKPKPNANGVAVITVTVTDNGPNAPPPNKNFITRTFVMTITPVNDLPVFTSLPVTSVVLNDAYVYPITATDADGDAITITALQKPSWTSLTQQGNGFARLAGTATPAGSSVVKLTARDPTGIVVEQDFTLTVNTRPVITSFALTTPEDIALPLSKTNFAAAFTDADGNAVKEIQFTKVPKHGSLFYRGNTLTAGAKVFASAIQQVVYIPSANYYGKDTLSYNARDTLTYSLAESAVSLVITPVNDPPEVSIDPETDSLHYEVGSGPVLLTHLFSVIDVDNDSLVSADVEFKTQNFKAGADLLGFKPGTLPATLRFTYNQTTGVLLITGRAVLKDYNDAFKVLLYESTNTTDAQLASKTVSVTLSDGKANSAEKDRYIKLIYSFVDLTVPTGFTPNGDGINEKWQIALAGQAEQYPNAIVRVYNKRGKVMFESHGLDTEWDGKVNGELVPADTYFYTIDLNLPFLKKTYRGPLTILYH